MKLNQNTKVRIIVGGVSVFTTVKQIRSNFGTSVSINRAVMSALSSLEDQTSRIHKPIGLMGFYSGHNVQIDIV